MTDIYYPPFPEGAAFQVELALRAQAEDPHYLEDSPYSAEDVDALRRMAGTTPDWMQVEEEELIEGDKWEILEAQTKKLFDALLSEQQNLGVKDNSEKMAFFRTASSLLDKLVGIQERAANLRQIHRFHDTVMNIMEDVLDAGQRTTVMDRLQSAIKPEGK